MVWALGALPPVGSSGKANGGVRGLKLTTVSFVKCAIFQRYINYSIAFSMLAVAVYNLAYLMV